MNSFRTAALLTIVTLAACAPDDAGVESAYTVPFSERDSAGIRIVESAGVALETVLPWVVDTVPDLELGRMDGDALTHFHDITGIQGLPDGGLIVLDGGSRELRWFEASGQPVRTAGRQGPGPGEFSRPLLVPRFEADSLLIFDRGRRSFTWVSIDGSGARALGTGPHFVGTPEAAAGSRALFRTAASGSASCPDNQGCDVPLLLRWVDVRGTVADTLVAYPNRMIRYTQSGPPVRLTGALDQRGAAAAGPDGLVVEGDARFELKQFDVAGQLIAIFRVDAPPRSTVDDALEQHVRQAPDPDGLARIYRMMGLPDVVPAFQALRVDQLGWFWAELFRPTEGGASVWLVFDREGRARGTVALPSGLEVHDIGEDHILGRWIDHLGVEHVRRHTLLRVQ